MYPANQSITVVLATGENRLLCYGTGEVSFWVKHNKDLIKLVIQDGASRLQEWKDLVITNPKGVTIELTRAQVVYSREMVCKVCQVENAFVVVHRPEPVSIRFSRLVSELGL